MAKKGSAEERDLVHKLWERDFAAMRAPASGGATKKPLPDVVAGNGKLYLAIEVKTTTKDKIYIDFPQIDALCEFSEKFGAKPYIGVKFKYTKCYYQNFICLSIPVISSISKAFSRAKSFSIL